MDIGNQQRVIIVEPVELPEKAPQPTPMPEPVVEPAGEWPLPLALDPEPVP